MNNEQLKRGEELLSKTLPLRTGCDGAIVTGSEEDWVVAQIVCRADNWGTTNEEDECIAAAMVSRVNTWPLLRDACIEFVRKCENGEAKSKRSYAQMKAALKEAGIGDDGA